MWCTVKQRLPFISSLCVINHQKEGDGAGEGKSSCSVQEQTTQLILGSQNFLICCWAAGSTQILSDNALVPSVSLPAFPESCSPEVPQSGTASLPTKTIDAVAQGGGGEHSSLPVFADSGAAKWWTRDKSSCLGMAVARICLCSG